MAVGNILQPGVPLAPALAASGGARYPEPVDAPMVARMRLVMAVAGLGIIYIDPHGIGVGKDIPLWIVAAYSVYSVGVYLATIFRRQQAWNRFAHWIDMLWYLLLIAFSSGSSSIFYVYFFFSILVASFGWGFREGIKVTLTSTALFTVVGILTVPDPPAGSFFELNRYLTRTVFLLVLGYLISYWGGCELTFRRRLGLLREVNGQMSSRLGLDRVLATTLELLRVHYGVESCLLLLHEPEMQRHSLYRVDRRGSHKAMAPVQLSRSAALPLLALPDSCAVMYRGAGARWSSAPRYHARDVLDGTRTQKDAEHLEGLANLLEAEAFASIPLLLEDRPVGRLFLTCSRRDRLTASELEFLSQYCQQLVAIIENIRLIDQLALVAAEKERRRISRDLHDSTIQPYIGLKLGLDALRRKIAPEHPLAPDVDSLSDMASQTITDLRNLVWDLKGRPAMRSLELVLAIEELAEKYARFYNIRLDIEAEGYSPVPDTLAAESLQIVTEALSNVRRHTQARQAVVRLKTEKSRLVVEVENPSDVAAAGNVFTPRSIAERVRTLGGSTMVRAEVAGSTLIHVELPLNQEPAKPCPTPA